MKNETKTIILKIGFGSGTNVEFKLTKLSIDKNED